MASVLAQKGVDLEYIVIDGGSTDGSQEVMKMHGDRLAYAISEPDSGVYNAMNKGLEKAKGEYVLFLNSGDRLVSHDTLEKLEPYLNGIDLVYGRIRYEKADGFFDANYYPETLSLYYLYHHYIPHPATFIRRRLFETAGYYDEKYSICADWVFFLKALGIYRASYRYAHQIVTIYDTQGISAQPENQAKIRNERIQALHELFPLFAKDFLADVELREQIASLRKNKVIRLLNKLGLLKI